VQNSRAKQNGKISQKFFSVYAYFMPTLKVEFFPVSLPSATDHHLQQRSARHHQQRSARHHQQRGVGS